MGKFFGGMAVAVVLGVTVWGFLVMPKGEESCNDRCGPGTHCEAGRCLVDMPEPDPEPEAEAEETGKKSKKKRRRKKKSGSSQEGAGTLTEQLGWDNDDGVPRHDPRKAQVIGENTGSERLSDAVINRELGKLDGAFQKCIEDAAGRSEEPLASGRVKYEFGIGPSGKVTGVNVRGPSTLRAVGVFPCVRNAIFGHRFPSFDGLEMSASGSFSI